MSVCAYVAEFTGGQGKGVSRGLHSTPDLFILKLEIRESERRLIIFLSISKCVGASGEGGELGDKRRATCTEGKRLYSPTISLLFLFSFFFFFTLLKFIFF